MHGHRECGVEVNKPVFLQEPDVASNPRGEKKDSATYANTQLTKCHLFPQMVGIVYILTHCK